MAAVKDAEEAAKLAEDAVKAEHAVAEAREAESAGADAASCATHSFVPSTGVRLADGTSKPISKVKVGDTVLATDPQTGVTAPEKVQNVIVTKTDKDFTALTLDTTPVRGPPQKTKADAPTRQTLTTTWHHPFWDATHHRWTNAHDLTAGTRLRTTDGTTVTVAEVHNFHRHQTTYDLTVGTLHTYYVLAGATPVLVHNCNDGYADVYFDDVEGHASVSVTHGDTTMHTEAGSQPGSNSVPGVRTRPHSPGTIVVRVPLPNATNAQ
ncbi:polymorphic toxin-type HINT domain-containing protein [Streptomyces sp. SAS_260]|uniref:polymorphic toxin-type HINT domain-containing protein n=1 Tax=Streptomyces sp. SAS_260 TaxID=3412751 RepID=UPI00403C3BCD